MSIGYGMGMMRMAIGVITAGGSFDLDRYSASLSATMRITPDNKNPTAGSRSMKSGYGVNQLVTTDVSSTQSSATTPAQNAVSYFSEFNYEMFWRLLEQMGGGYNTRFEFQKNEYSTYRGRTHFNPYLVSEWLVYCEHLAHRLLDASRNAVHEPKRLTHDPGQSLG